MIEEVINCLLEQEEGLHDFGDGNGLVPAHRHRNPDGTFGGWVANTAYVSIESYVTAHSEVFGKARVYRGAKIRYFSKVYDSAEVYNGAEVRDHAQVFGNARVHGANTEVHTDALVYGDAEVSGGALVRCGAEVYERAVVRGYVVVYGGAKIYGRAKIEGGGLGSVEILEGTEVFGDVSITTYSTDIVFGGEGVKVYDQESLMKAIVQSGGRLSTTHLLPWEVEAQDLFFSKADELGYDTTLSNLEDFLTWVEAVGATAAPPSERKKVLLKALEDWAEEMQ